MRVGILGLIQESNTFLSGRTTLEHFREDVLATGPAIAELFAGAHHEIGGFLEGLGRTGLEAVPIFAARALPYGVLAAEAFDELLGDMQRELTQAGPLDGLLLAVHGATVAENHRDADGHWLSRLRRIVGDAVPLVATIDPHANVSAEMVDACDAIVAYRTNPHVDQRERGVEAARLVARTLAGEIRPVMRAAFPPMAIGIESQLTAASPCKEFYERTSRLADHPQVLSHSVVLGFPYADVEEMGSSILFITDDDPALAAELAEAAAIDLWRHRQDFRGNFIGVDEALERAAALDGPVCLLEMGDNVGGGSPGDATHLAAALHRRKTSAFVCLHDPASAGAAQAAGVGGSLPIEAGGRSGPLNGAPLKARVTVLGLYDGVFEEHEPRHGGFSRFDQGPTAVVRAESGLVLMLTTRRMAPFSLQQLKSCGVDPRSFKVLVAKGVHAPRAAYEEVCRHFIRVDTPGVTSADMRRLDYRHRRKPMYPFEEDAAWAVASPAKGSAS